MSDDALEVDKLSCAECRLLGTCPNLRGPRVSPAKSPFMSTPIRRVPCLRFEPKFRAHEAQARDMREWLLAYERQWLPRPIEASYVALVLDGDQEIRYYVPLADWITCDIYRADGSLKAAYRERYRHTRKWSGGELVREFLACSVIREKI